MEEKKCNLGGSLKHLLFNIRMPIFSLVGLGLLTTLVCCTSKNKEVTTEFPTRINEKLSQKYETESQFIQVTEAKVDSRRFSEAQKDLVLFLKAEPQSSHWFQGMFLLGKSLEGLEDWNGALGAYKDIIGRSSERQMEFIALSFYRLAYCYEALGLNENALASLVDAMKHRHYLPLEIASAEIPARIATIYARLNQMELADRYTKVAETGIIRLKGMKSRKNKEWISRSLYAMGSISVNQLNKDTFTQSIRTLKRNQKYLLQVIELGQSPWQDRAKERLAQNYSKLMDFIDSYSEDSSEDREVNFVQQSKSKSEFLTLYLESLQVLKGLQAPTESPLYFSSLDLFSKIKGLEELAVAKLDDEMLKRPEIEREIRSTASVRDSKQLKIDIETPPELDPRLFNDENSNTPLPRKLPKKRFRR